MLDPREFNGAEKLPEKLRMALKSSQRNSRMALTKQPYLNLSQFMKMESLPKNNKSTSYPSSFLFEG